MLCNIGMLYYIAKMLNNKACTPCNAEKDIENDTGGINWNYATAPKSYKQF